MRAGTLRSRIWFDEPTVDRDSSGGEILGFTPRFQLWAEVSNITGGEAVTANQLLAGVNAKITVRFGSKANQISAKWRARFGADVFDIGPPLALDYRRQEIDFTAALGKNLS